MLAIGLMSGTSMDGIDVALIETDGRAITLTRGANGRPDPLGPTGERPYSDSEAALLVRAKDDARTLARRTDRPGATAEAERLVTALHAEAVERFLRENGLAASDIAVIGFHGQTLLHRPEAGLTVQIGDGQALADRLGIPVVHDLRAADVAAGGQGAPLVPVFHRALAQASGFGLPVAVLNIGGVANVTFLGEGDAMAGFDTGPGNALLNDLMAERGRAPFDRDGATAAAGRTNDALLAWLLAHPYFAEPPPKSLDRDAFSHRAVARLTLEDAAATLTSFTVEAIVRSVAFAAESPRQWIVGGGGARNAEMMRRLRERLAVEVSAADEVGWSTDGLEAQAFAYLAARTLAGLPITFPATTGAPRPLPGGVVARPR